MVDASTQTDLDEDGNLDLEDEANRNNGDLCEKCGRDVTIFPEASRFWCVICRWHVGDCCYPCCIIEAGVHDALNQWDSNSPSDSEADSNSSSDPNENYYSSDPNVG